MFLSVLQEENSSLRAKIDSLQDKYYYLSLSLLLAHVWLVRS